MSVHKSARKSSRPATGHVPVGSLPPLGFPAPSGTAMASGRITFAESQLMLNSDRLAKPGTPTAGRTLPGGTVPFGRILVRAEPDSWRLAPDPEYAAVVAGLVRR